MGNRMMAIQGEAERKEERLMLKAALEHKWLESRRKVEEMMDVEESQSLSEEILAGAMKEQTEKPRFYSN